ncbi:serine/threonine-protein kinase, SIK1/2 [Artemisia annua]|uniref:Serine/threonine-protein kinase, SIK1/2 n=1 Tax=Artemisia annua TaxID=35608 RepID=A0A2U1MUL2_ARTAN|nr:serine/threonine-protein kinase, SIK1/2 [Artemisia annua]
MSSAEVNLEKFLIPLEEFKRATENFKSKYDYNSFYDFYKGQLSEEWHNRTSLIAFSKENHDPREELEIVSRFHHKNIIPFIGYCECEGNRMLFAYEYPTNGSLDRYLRTLRERHLLTWAKRLKICIGLAKGLNYLHSGGVIHRDLRDKHIFLDENLEPSITGFHISVLVPGNQPHPQIYKPAPQLLSSFVKLYFDPIYQGSSILNTESDVYSYGMIMFQMLIVKDFYENNEVNRVRNCSDGKRWELMDRNIRHHIDRRSFNMFTDIAYKCISFNIKDRPTMDEIVETLEEALDIHIYRNKGKIAKYLGLES